MSVSYVYSDSVVNSQTFKYYNVGGLYSGDIIPYNNSDFIFVNGIKLISGVDYSISGSVAKITTGDFEGVNCDIWGVNSNVIINLDLSNESVVSRENNQLKYAVFKNKKRIRRNTDYFPVNENSNIYSLQNLNIPNNLETIQIYD